ncbi:MAG: signal peptidase I [Bacilli bacterium]
MTLKYKKISYIVLSLLIILISLMDLTNFSIRFQSMYVYVIKPLVWLFMLIFVVIALDNDFIKNTKYKKTVDFNMIILTIIYFLLYFSSGYLKGFAYNPFTNTIKGLLLNVWSFGVIIIVKEYIRYFAINNLGKNNIILKFFLISLLLVLPEIDIVNITNHFSNGLSLFKYFIQYLVPQITISMFLSYVSYYSGFFMPLVYRLFPLVMQLVLPMLPKIDWFCLSLLNTVIPFFGFLWINYRIQKDSRILPEKEIKKMRLTNTIIPLFVLVFVLIFGLGILPYRPVVIVSNSMLPKFEVGDIVLIKDVKSDEIKIGDILQYQMDNYTVIHRVEEIKHNENGEIYFIMKGDNNKNIDLYPVYSGQVLGKAKLNIKYLGYPTIWINRLLHNNLEQSVTVETGN